MFEVVVFGSMALSVGVAVFTFVSARRAGRSPTVWPFFALAAFVLIEARAFVETPSLTNALQANPSDLTTTYIARRRRPGCAYRSSRHSRPRISRRRCCSAAIGGDSRA